MDMTIVEHVDSQTFDDKQSGECRSDAGSPEVGSDYEALGQIPSVFKRLSIRYTACILWNSTDSLPSNQCTDVFSSQEAGRKQPLLKSWSKDSSFSSAVPAGSTRVGFAWRRSKEATRPRSPPRRSESESGIVSEGDTENTANSEICMGRPQKGDAAPLHHPQGVTRLRKRRTRKTRCATRTSTGS
ncbi:hypothetical protein DPEC_G00291730 [Dallia pectoralis]|uniref:Uncharacterized protein n=1 Tax=Dallia pectoralis TaxID=75939 RepID=A0ACC2FHU1_DALPE|nr:hypothetical protein DPEC_G00291730 [Dallia pectoralis]